MARTDGTPWQPGYVVLTDEDLQGENPYTNRRLNPEVLYKNLQAVALTCYQSDDNISLIRRQSKLME
jgi:hypothetical protein